PVYAGVLALGELLGTTEVTIREAVLFEPGDGPAAVGVEVALLLGQRLVEGLVHQRERIAHGERLALGVEHLRVTGGDRHARTNGRLRKVHRRDVAALEMGKRLRQLRLEGREELAARSGGGIASMRAANEHDARGECIGVLAAHAIAKFGAHWPGAG